jgi:hypothetical protein
MNCKEVPPNTTTEGWQDDNELYALEKGGKREEEREM